MSSQITLNHVLSSKSSFHTLFVTVFFILMPLILGWEEVIEEVNAINS